MMASEAEIPVTICPPGKRAWRRPPPKGELVQADPVKEKRVTALQEAREKERIMSVVRAQPHRRDLANADDKRAGEPLWIYCERFRVKRDLYRAGLEYGAIVRQARVAIDAPATGLVAGGGEDDGLTEEQRASALALAKQRRNEADGVLRGVMDRAPSVMSDLCCDMRPWRARDEGLIKNALYRLAVHFKTIDFGINAEKVY